VHLEPIDSQIFNRSPAINGSLLLLDDCIRFEPYPSPTPLGPIVLNLLGYVSSTLRPHPCEVPIDELPRGESLTIVTVDLIVIVTVTLRKDLHGPEIEVYEFTGWLSELTPFQAILEARARAMQAAPNARPVPTPIPILLPPAIREGDSAILSAADSGHIRGAFPSRFKKYGWRLLYRSSRDGCSFTAFSSAVRKKPSVLLVFRTHLEEKIGVFLTNEIALNAGHVLGTGDAFVFSFTPRFEAHRWARTAEFFVAASDRELAVGGGGSAAIWIDGEFLHAFSERCAAFSSPMLTKEPRFDLYEIEAWYIGQ
jgi:hypothetical protein